MTFKVQCRPSGHEFSVESGESVLDAALRQGITLPYGCRDGKCGTCKGKLLAGQVHYNDDQPEALADEDIRNGLAVFCQARPDSDLSIEVNEVDQARGIPIMRLPCRIAHIEELAHDVLRIDLKLPDNKRMLFLAGQYINFLLKDGRHRAFSIANAPHDDAYIELHIRNVDGGEFTDYLFSELKEKTLMRIEGPLGTFFIREDSDRPIILMAGGTGFAPIKGMVEQALMQKSQRPMHVYWGVRAQRDLYMAELPIQWAQTYEHIQFTPVLSDPRPEDNWTGRTGYVHDAIVADYNDLSGHEIYAGGPPIMVHAGHDAFLAHGLLSENYYSDAFEFADDKQKRK